MGYKLTNEMANAFAALELPSLQAPAVVLSAPAPAPRPNGYEPA
jgi:hypothetical protein